MSILSDLSQKWEGRIVDDKFLLQEWLGGSEHSAVFLTQRSGPAAAQPAALKLVSAAGFSSRAFDEEAQLSRWRDSARLIHPNLIRLFECGRATLDGQNFLYLVMELAEEDLGQILPMRPLSSEEISGMLPPTLDALAFLHKSGFVHARLQPANIMAVQDQLKLSLDGLGKSGEATLMKTAYDAPELATGKLSPPADSWSLGAMLVAVLTQNVPQAQGRPGGPGETAIPASIAQPFREIAQQCLRLDPGARATVNQIASQLNGTAPAAASDPIPAPTTPVTAPTAPLAAAADTYPASSPTADSLASTPLPPPRSLARPSIILPIIVAALLVAFLLARKPKSQPPPQPAPASQNQSPANPPPASPPASVATTPVEKPANASHSRGRVLHQALPEVSQSSLGTVKGRVKVSIRVSVSPSGNVTQARITSAGPSRYFASRSLESARHWKFDPPKVNDQPVSSEWLLRFEFTRNSKRTFPSQTRP
jgi:TonB family protein